MKTNVVKIMMLPIAAFMLASAAAVTTNDVNESKADVVTMTGYIHAPLPSSCQSVEVECDENGSVLCTIGASQVFDLDTGTTCAKPLYRI
ncbi:hypothetical protein J3S90_09600 [Flavobacterium sp. P4023]|uniref:Uncharacterized protein n=1 Tax=Flavobacterium flabelliforme TaxID=2816119 RepID=A0ABS5CTV9_9FLAO|nr:DUF6520 family protein [Flavobacterium flabelliforme]MBP4142057.1 hypothetical protein [Flavobacterium flabelliforme]